MNIILFSADSNTEVIILDNILSEVPIGFGMQLAQNLNAMNYFANLDDQGKKEVVNKTKKIRSKEEMEQFVSSLGSDSSFK